MTKEYRVWSIEEGVHLHLIFVSCIAPNIYIPHLPPAISFLFSHQFYLDFHPHILKLTTIPLW
jgi:hypothetical protein